MTGLRPCALETPCVDETVLSAVSGALLQAATLRPRTMDATEILGIHVAPGTSRCRSECIRFRGAMSVAGAHLPNCSDTSAARSKCQSASPEISVRCSRATSPRARSPVTTGLYVSHRGSDRCSADPIDLVC